MNAAQLARSCALANAHMNGTCTIREVASVSDNAGGQTDTWSDLATGVACYSYPEAAGNELEAAASTIGVRRWVVILPAGTPVTTRNRILIAGATVELEVLALDGAQRTYEIKRVASCVEVT